MKKLILSVLFMSLSVASFSQTFVEKYTTSISKKEGVFGEWKNTNVTVVFNEKETGDIVFYYDIGTSKRFHQIGDVSKDITKSKETYQIIMAIDSEDGTKVAIQLFDDDTTLRILIAEGYFVEFHK
jgi:hypothetical protein